MLDAGTVPPCARASMQHVLTRHQDYRHNTHAGKARRSSTRGREDRGYDIRYLPTLHIPYSELPELYDLAAHVSNDADPQYLESLRSKMQATSELVGAFVRLGGQSQANIVQDSEYRARQKAQTEVRRLQ